MFPSTAKYPTNAKQAPINSPQKSCFIILTSPLRPLPKFFSLLSLGHGIAASKEITSPSSHVNRAGLVRWQHAVVAQRKVPNHINLSGV